MLGVLQELIYHEIVEVKTLEASLLYDCMLSFGLNPPVYIDTGGARVTQSQLQRKESSYPNRQACLPRKGESHPDKGRSLLSCIFIVQQSV